MSTDIEFPNWTVYLNSGHEVNERPNVGVAFMVTRRNVTVAEFIGYCNKIANGCSYWLLCSDRKPLMPAPGATKMKAL